MKAFLAFCSMVVFASANAHALAPLDPNSADGSKTASTRAAEPSGSDLTGASKVTPKSALRSGGVRTSAGDVNGDGRGASPALPADTLKPAQKAPSGLLLPAIQKVREAAKK